MIKSETFMETIWKNIEDPQKFLEIGERIGILQEVETVNFYDGEAWAFIVKRVD